jgi:mono/diheme cytochrome c family protein
MRSNLFTLVALAGLASCASEPPAPALDEAAVVAASMPIAQGFQAELQAQLKAAIADGGPKGGVSVCQQAAPAIAAAQSDASGAVVSRIAAKHRNPAGGVPDDMRDAYAALAAAPMVDGKPNRQIVQTGSGAGAKVHVLSAIPMQEQPCSVCHGTSIDPDLKAHIDSLYPGDLATGFQPGELRGALLISWDAARFRK